MLHDAVRELKKIDPSQGFLSKTDCKAIYGRKRLMLISDMSDLELKMQFNTIDYGFAVDVFECPYGGMSHLLEDPKGYGCCIIEETVLQRYGIGEHIRERFQFDANQFGVSVKFPTEPLGCGNPSQLHNYLLGIV